jgi:hypothetical protein
VKVSRAIAARSWITGLGYLAAGLMMAMLSQPGLASAADRKARGDTALSVVRGPSVDQRELPELSPGTVVLRGSRPVSPNAGNSTAGQPYPAASEAEAAAAGPAGPLNAAPGWDRQFDMGGLDTSAAPPMFGPIGMGR